MKNHLSALTIFIGSFLLFAIQPMLGSTLLPYFGGTAAVWVVCLAAYQTLLLGGYYYAHRLSQTPPARQCWLHPALLLLATLWIAAFTILRPKLHALVGHTPLPAFEVLLCVILFVGIPYTLLAAGSTLIQFWLTTPENSSQCSVSSIQYSDLPPPPIHAGGRCVNATPTASTGGSRTATPQHSPLNTGSTGSAGSSIYSLYALSNLGSFAGLFTYAFIIEPLLPLQTQWWSLTTALTLYTLLIYLLSRSRGSNQCSVSSIQYSDLPDNLNTEHSTLNTKVATAPLLWLLLPALSVFTLNSITAHLGNDLTPLPMLWVILLATFLLSYVIGFTTPGIRLLRWLPWALIPLCLINAWYWGVPPTSAFLYKVGFNTALLLASCVMLHAWLYEIRPPTQHLTRYYLSLAAGGALGGILASLIAPLIFNSILEYPLLLLLLSTISGYRLTQRWRSSNARGESSVTSIQCSDPLSPSVPDNLNTEYSPLLTAGHGIAAACAIACAAILLLQTSKIGGSVLKRMRNFYGSSIVRHDHLKVVGGEDYPAHVYFHSSTMHGLQALGHNRHEPTLYFGRHAGGLAITSHSKYATTQNMRVAVAGMGMGTLAVYGRPGDTYRFYEINPQVVKLARDERLFTFLSDSSADIQVIVDDGRRALENERTRNEEPWDVLIIDVYSGDAIPPHMSTHEAFQLYLDRLAPDGTLAFHLTNWHLDLSPMVKAAAQTFDLHLQGYGCWAERFSMGSYWSFMTRQPNNWYIPAKHGRIEYHKVRDIPLMRDEHHTLLPYISYNAKLKFEQQPPEEER